MKTDLQPVQGPKKQSPQLNGELQRAALNEAPVTNAPPIVHEVLQSPGQPLDVETRAFFEPRFGHDFSGVRVHTDAKAAESARAVNAHAYTVGSDFVFGSGLYSPETENGRRLVGHELVHVCQQTGGSDATSEIKIGPKSDTYEREANFISRQVLQLPVVQALPVSIAHFSPIRLQRTSAEAADHPAGSLGARGKHIDAEDEASMCKDVDKIVRMLRAGASLNPTDQRLAVSIISSWKNRDMDENLKWGKQGDTLYLDRFLFMLKTRTMSRRTYRTFWTEEFMLAYDGLWYTLKDDRLADFKKLVTSSRLQRTSGPMLEQMESGWSYIGKRESIAGWMIIKGLGMALIGLVDTGIWAYWKSIPGMTMKKVFEHFGMNTDNYYLSPYMEKNFEEVTSLIAKAEGVDMNEEVDFGNGIKLSLRTVTSLAGKVVGSLTMAGALGGLGGPVNSSTAGSLLSKLPHSPAIPLVIGGVQSLQAAEQLFNKLQNIFLSNPELTAQEVLTRPDVLADMVGIISGALGAKMSFSATGSELLQQFTKMGLALNAGQAALLVAAYQRIDQDPTLKTAEEKQRAKEEYLSQIITNGLLTVDQRWGKAFLERQHSKTSSVSTSSGKSTKSQSDAEKVNKPEMQPIAVKVGPKPKETATTQDHTSQGTNSRTIAGRVAGKKQARSVSEETPRYVALDSELHHRLIHETEIMNVTAEAKVRSKLIARPKGEPRVETGTYRKGIKSYDEAYQVYEEALARAEGREVGIFRNIDTGEYSVNMGSSLEKVVKSPPRGNWEGVLHYHPNSENIKTFRGPAPADLAGTCRAAANARRPVTEFVEHELPDGSRGRTAYTVTPEGKIKVEYFDENNQPVVKNFENIAKYDQDWGGRKRYFDLDPKNPDLQEMRLDLERIFGPVEDETSNWHFSVDKKVDLAAESGGGGEKTRGRRKKIPVSANPTKETGIAQESSLNLAVSQRLERLRMKAKLEGIPFKMELAEKLLHQQKTSYEVERVLNEIEDRLKQAINKNKPHAGEEESLHALGRTLPDIPPQSRREKGDLTDEGPRAQLPPGHEDIIEEIGASIKKSPGGKTENPKTVTGKFAHSYYELLTEHPEILKDLVHRVASSNIFSRKVPRGIVSEKEYCIKHPLYSPNRFPRIDRLWRAKDTIYEIKPRGSAKLGMVEAQQYAEWMDRFEPLPAGRKWKSAVILYDQKKLMTYLKKIGILPE